MASGYFNYPQPYYNGPSIFTVTAGNDIGRIENPLIRDLEPSTTERQRPVRLRILTIVSVFFNLIFAAAIAWSLTSHFVDKENAKISVLPTSVPDMSGTVGSLRSKPSRMPCKVSLSSAVCMPCLSLHSTLLWNGKVVKVRAGKTDLCCRQIEHSLKRLTKEVGDLESVYLICPDKIDNEDHDDDKIDNEEDYDDNDVIDNEDDYGDDIVDNEDDYDDIIDNEENYDDDKQW